MFDGSYGESAANSVCGVQRAIVPPAKFGFDGQLVAKVSRPKHLSLPVAEALYIKLTGCEHSSPWLFK